MDTATIRQQLHNYLEIADDKKINEIYTMVKDEINEVFIEYSTEFKAELDKRVEYYLNGEVMVSPAEMNKRLQTLRTKRNK